MSDTVIKVNNLGKMYRIGETIRHDTLRDAITAFFHRKLKADSQKLKAETIWALKDVSFEIKRGEVVGIIGRNGAGKTTLLKLLSRITEPTEGRAEIRGRVGSLLEVGTGFHPELTGRENIFLNGAVLGMTKQEIKKKFDEIVSFSEFEKFVDTPVKRYSSGMLVRLAFAVAAHLEPEILLVDEVLAVGDVSFQKKCLGKMGDVAKGGRTVLFVSHNMQAIRNLCPRVILLHKGEIASDARTEKSISNYSQILKGTEINEETGIHDGAVRRGSGTIRFTTVEIQDNQGNRRLSFKMGETIRFKLSYKVFEEMHGLAIYVGLRSGITREIVTSARHVISSDRLVEPGSAGTVTVEFPDADIRPGEYPLYLHISDGGNKRYDFDVLDDLTAPIIIDNESIKEQLNFDPSRPIGYFSVRSRVVLSEIGKPR